MTASHLAEQRYDLFARLKVGNPMRRSVHRRYRLFARRQSGWQTAAQDGERGNRCGAGRRRSGTRHGSVGGVPAHLAAEHCPNARHRDKTRFDVLQLAQPAREPGGCRCGLIHTDIRCISVIHSSGTASMVCPDSSPGMGARLRMSASLHTISRFGHKLPAVTGRNGEGKLNAWSRF